MIYDHEREAEPLSERPVADWGGDELFTAMPRRFARHAEGRPRRFAGASATHGVRRGAVLDGQHAPALAATTPAAPAAPRITRYVGEEPESSAPIVTGDEAVVTLAPAALAARRTGARSSAADGVSLAERAAPVLVHSAPRVSQAPSPSPPAGDVGPAAAPTPTRRTVTITGRPGVTAAPVRRRPSPTVHDRLGGRPDRIAAWAFGLGITLILIAVGTADAAPL